MSDKLLQVWNYLKMMLMNWQKYYKIDDPKDDGDVESQGRGMDEGNSDDERYGQFVWLIY